MTLRRDLKREHHNLFQSPGRDLDKGSVSATVGQIRVELTSERRPSDQVLSACQCSFCRKHNATTFSDPKSHVTLIATDPRQLQRYSFGLRTSDQIICRRCGVYVAMTLVDEGQVWSVINVDTLDDRALFTRTPEARDYSTERS
jgi:hypothetical protein